MGERTKEEKKALLQKYKAAQKRRLILKKAQARRLFDFLERELENDPCDETLRRTRQWLERNIPQEGDRGPILAEIQDMGGCCDCEVLANCYEDYDL